MNGRVVKRMMNFDLIIKVPGKKNALGDTIYKQLDAKCYIKEELAIIYDTLGKEVTSSLQLYVTGEDGIKIPSNALLSIGHYQNDSSNSESTQETNESGSAIHFVPLYKDRTIIKREIFYKPSGIADVGVFYLP